jgi:mono/diheme cytochrome c family protein
MRRRDADIVGAVDAALTRLVAAGRVAEVLARYGVTVPDRTSARDLDVILAQQKDPVEAGRSLFSTACSRCHGAEGAGGGTGGSLPKLKNYDGGWDKFYRIVWTGRKNTAMAAFNGILTPDEVRNIYEYLTSLK